MRFSLLVAFGWTEARDTAFPSMFTVNRLDPDCVPARVTRHDRGRWTLATEHGECHAELRAKLRGSLDSSSRPTVGDLQTDQFASWQGLQREVAFQAR